MTTHVQIRGITPRVQYTADGSLKTYTFPFAIFNESDIRVYLNDTLQADTTYTVSGVKNTTGGSITLVTAPASGTLVTIIRSLSIERTTDFQEGGALRADTLNDELDYQIACQQQIADNLNRSMVLPPYAIDSNVDLTLPTPSAGKAIVWNSDGTNLENSTVSVNALESTLKGYKTAAEAAASTATTKAGIATDAASTATTQAQTATTQAGIATTQAGIATTKATEVSQALSTKANTAMDNLTTAGKEAVVNLVMPGYFSKNRVNVTSDVWYLAEKDILVSALVNPGIIGGIYASDDGGTTAAFIMPCTTPTAGLNGASVFIRKGLYYKVVANNAAYYDELMGE